ncbi:MAG: CaiB/BaiF CoA-transferase family protein [Alphaproteobacteria bacterium]|jgi:crotonobetainyl-CoA:carnitine CoA-transferase CaiB-like acyl-CoA transferase|nr:formyl-CoA transferase [Nisaea sp.]MDP7380715.1 CaiB/BaiF CoA-transferase family protein [Alphaproteobacteria bacterium]MEC7123720.1 CaiB/BaiF CoA-transferase family protein [Pseudomonadota bacterium]MEC7515687.1 CaiB/BaiF CoA-transferase family protein [Pseudomonadota bacterium]MEC7675409.1 CaiB/BaiF CoA-transferase family protein [Pseudomonadota bacterium]|tara:strand:+ start:260 stop:1456 length:1197 start_codon:yes stop_codon:yes gene_type:complete
MPFAPASTALKRFKVLDLTRVRAGPTCVRQLADWGANVIKIEAPVDPAGGDSMGGPRHGSDFQNLHRNKRALSLNLKDPEGLAIFKKLAAEADVIVENYRPDVKTRLGIDYETLSQDNPGLVYASISGFGQDGPYAKRPGFDQIAQGMGGLMSITGAPGEGPMRVGIPIADLTAGLFAAQGIFIALLEREDSGKGQWIHTSLLQAQIFMLDFQASRWTMSGEVAGQAGNNHPTSIPTGAFKTSDGFINLAVSGGEIWQRCAKVLGREDLIDNPDYKTGGDRSRNRDTLNAIIQEILEQKSSGEWVDAFNAAGVPCGPIYAINEVFEDPQVRHLGMARDVASPTLGRDIALINQPIMMSRTPTAMASHPPDPGEQSDEILGELGLSAAEIDDLRARRVI